MNSHTRNKIILRTSFWSSNCTEDTIPILFIDWTHSSILRSQNLYIEEEMYSTKKYNGGNRRWIFSYLDSGIIGSSDNEISIIRGKSTSSNAIGMTHISRDDLASLNIIHLLLNQHQLVGGGGRKEELSKYLSLWYQYKLWLAGWGQDWIWGRGRCLYARGNSVWV